MQYGPQTGLSSSSSAPALQLVVGQGLEERLIHSSLQEAELLTLDLSQLLTLEQCGIGIHASRVLPAWTTACSSAAAFAGQAPGETFMPG